MKRISSFLLLLIAAAALTETVLASLSSPSTPASAFVIEDYSSEETLPPLRTPSPTNLMSLEEEAIVRRELEWAETAMEEYKRKNGKHPLRSTINAPHVHTEEWKNDSIGVVISGRTTSRGALRGRRKSKDEQ